MIGEELEIEPPPFLVGLILHESFKGLDGGVEVVLNALEFLRRNGVGSFGNLSGNASAAEE